jgi:redox-sensitive bicupin YhaK (pirin superfamily)
MVITISALLVVGLIDWRALPHIDRGQVVRSAAAAVFAPALVTRAAVPPGGPVQPRSAASIDAWAAIPVWPAWPTPTSPTGGRVRPITPDPALADPFLLLAHHRHSFSPNDPLRGPFREVGGALGLPYVGDEGFKLHPHRGIDIWTIVLDGSDGFRHRDSLGGECTYRGGSCQFMRSGRGAMHEEMWETRSDRPTSIELFQLWVNLPARLKMTPPAIRYVGRDWRTPYTEETSFDANGVPTRVRHLDGSALQRAAEGEGDVLEPRPPVAIMQASIAAGGSWVAPAAAEHTALCYVRRGAVRVNGQILGAVPAGSTCTFRADGDSAWLVNAAKDAPADVLLLTGAPLREPVAMGGPIVMNEEREIQQAYAELRAGTFLR